MWYVIQTISGKEHEVCIWINTYVDRSLYKRCFVPLYEDVWRKEGIGHISIRKMFSGYLFLESDTPELVHEALKEVPKLTMMLSLEEKSNGRTFLPIREDEEAFLDTILSDGLMKVSYVHRSGRGNLSTVIGPLQSYTDHIVRVDIPHRRAIVDVPMLGETRRIKFGLWLDIDPKIAWIEEEKWNRLQTGQEEDARPADMWDWKAWKKINADKASKNTEEDIYGYQVGDQVINTTGIYGDTPLEIVEIRPGKNSVVVNVPIFGKMTRVEMGMGEVSSVNWM